MTDAIEVPDIVKFRTRLDAACTLGVSLMGAFEGTIAVMTVIPTLKGLMKTLYGIDRPHGWFVLTYLETELKAGRMPKLNQLQAKFDEKK